MKRHRRMTITLGLALVAGMAALSIGTVGRAQDAPAGELVGPPPELLAEFDMPRDGSLVVLPVTFKGKTYRFLVDTGSRFSTFDASFAPLLGEPKGELEGEMSNGKMMTLRIFYAPDAQVGPLSMKLGGQVMCLDLTELRRLSGLDVQGVIGMGLLRQYVVQFDVDAGKMRFYKPTDGVQNGWGEAVAMRLQEATPVLRGSIGEKYNALFSIHTGYEYAGALGKRFFASLQEAGIITKVTTSLVGDSADQSEESLSARVNGFHVGAFTMNGMIFDRSTQVTSLLGMGWLSRFNATFDFLNSRLYLKKSHLFDATRHADMSGLHLIQAEKGAKVHAVDPDSPASLAGIQAGDVILKLDEQWVVKMSLAEVRQLLRSGDGKTLTVIFQRGEQGYRTPLTLKQQI